MGCAESRNTVQPQGVFSVVTPGTSAATTAASPSSSNPSRLFQRNSKSAPPAAAKTAPKKHKPNVLVPEPQGPTLPPPDAIGPPASAAAIPGGGHSSPANSAHTGSTSPSVAAIANAKPSASSPLQSPPPLVAGPSLLLLPTDKQSLQHLTFEELSIQFLKAVKNGDLAYMERVAQQAAKSATSAQPSLINIRGMWESTPLIYACQYCHPKAAMWLLEHGANVRLQNEKGVTPLLLASLEGMTDVVDWILKQYMAGEQHGHAQDAAVQSAADTLINIDKQVGVVYNSAADLNIRVNPLLAAAMNGHVEIIAKLLAHRASVNLGVPASAAVASAKQFALLLAAKYGHASVVRILIKHGADFATSDANDSHALLLACEASKEECAMELLRLLPASPLAAAPSSSDAAKDADHSSSMAPSPPVLSNSYVTAWKQANCHGLTALHFAAANGLVSVVQSMLVRLQWGSDREFLNATSVNRRECALLMACRKRQSEVVQLLVTVGADFELADRGGTTALQVLKRDKKDELVKLCESKKLGSAGAPLQPTTTGASTAKSAGTSSEESTATSSSHDSDGATAAELAIDMTESQVTPLQGGDGEGKQEQKLNGDTSIDTQPAKTATAEAFDWDAALEPVVSSLVMAQAAGELTASSELACGVSSVETSKVATLPASGSSRFMSFSPNAVRAANSFELQQQQELERIQASSTNDSIQQDATAVAVIDKGDEKETKPSELTAGETTTAATSPEPTTSAENGAENDPVAAHEPSPPKPKAHRKKEHAHKTRSQTRHEVKDDGNAGDDASIAGSRAVSRVSSVESVGIRSATVPADSSPPEPSPAQKSTTAGDDWDAVSSPAIPKVSEESGASTSATSSSPSVKKTTREREPAPPVHTPPPPAAASPGDNEENDAASPKKERRKKKKPHANKKSKHAHTAESRSTDATVSSAAAPAADQSGA